MHISKCRTSAFRVIYRRKLKKALSRIDELSRGEELLTIVKRMRKIKLAADLSLALTSHGTAWSRALIIKSTSELKTDKRLVKEIVGSKIFNDLVRIKRSNAYCHKHPFLSSRWVSGRMFKYMKDPMFLSRNIIHKSIHRKSALNISVRPCADNVKVAMKTILNERKLRQLQRVIPGGESMNSSACLLREAADYIISLRTQVQVMHSLANDSSTQHL